MTRSVLFGAVALGLFGHVASATAQGVYVNGVYTESGGSITIPDNGQINIGTTPTNGTPIFGTTYDQPTANSQYQVIEQAPDTYNVVIPAQQVAPVAPVAPVTFVEPAPSKGWAPRSVYVAARVGLVAPRDTNFDVDAGGRSLRLDNRYDDPGYTGSVAVGYQVAPKNGWIGYRVELEGGYQTAEVESHRVETVGTVRGRNALGDTDVLYGFVNAYGDLPITDRLSLSAGGGVGVGYVEFDGHGTRAGGVALDDSATAFGYHLDAGLSYQVTEQIAVEALYRYQSFVDAEFTTENGNDTEIDIDSHNFIAGVRVGF